MSAGAAPPAVDVGIPAYGRPRFLREAIESVVAQTLPTWRLAVGEDGAGGGPVEEVARPYLDDPRVRLAPSGEHLGSVANLSRLLAVSDAPYVALLHDDDRWDPEFLERRVAFLDEHPECALAFGGNVEIDDAGHEIGRTPFYLPEGVHGPERFVPQMLERNVVGTPSVVVRRSALEAVGPTFDARFPLIYDFELWLRLGARFPVAYLHAHDSAYRIHPQQLSKERDFGREHLLLLEHVEALLGQTAPHLLPPAAQRARLRASHLLSMALDETERGERAPASAHLRAAVASAPSIVADRRVPALLAGLALGRPGRAALAHARGLVRGRRDARRPGSSA